MLYAHEYSQYFRIKRISCEYLNQVLNTDPSMFDLNEMVLQQSPGEQELNEDIQQELASAV